MARVKTGAKSRALTRRELEVLAGGAAGETVCQTAARLGLSIYTVREHRRHAAGRLDAPTFTAAAVTAARAGLV